MAAKNSVKQSADMKAQKAIRKGRSPAKATTGLPFERLVILSNPASTGAVLSGELATQLKTLFGAHNTTEVATNKPPENACKSLISQARLLGPGTLLAVGGGDGTVNQVLNTLLQHPELSDAARQTVVLPLWGGNANDLAYMLNGAAAKVDIAAIVRRGNVSKVYPIAMICSQPQDETNDKEPQTQLASNYISFGASAAAAQAINRKDHRSSRLHNIPGGRLAQELLTITRAMVRTPRFRIREDGDTFRVYERAFINGPRFAKVERVALDLAEPQFSVATVERKRTSSLIIHTLRLADRRYRSEMTATKARFVLLDPVLAQIDGESIELPARTDVTLRIYDKSLYALGSRSALDLDPPR